MPKLSTFFESKFLKKEDAVKPMLLTIKGFTEEDLAMQGQPSEMKLIVHFNEIGKGLVLNPTNSQLLQLATGADSTEGNIGKKIVLFNDPSVSMGGKLVGGLRIRAPKGQATPPAPYPTAPAANPEADPDQDDVPF